MYVENSKVLITQLCPTLCDPMNCSPQGSSGHRILQVRTLEWVAIPFSRGSSWPKDWTQVSRITGRFLYRLSQQESPKRVKLSFISDLCRMLELGAQVQQLKGPSWSSCVIKGKSVNITFLSFLRCKMWIINTPLGIWRSDGCCPVSDT